MLVLNSFKTSYTSLIDRGGQHMIEVFYTERWSGGPPVTLGLDSVYLTCSLWRVTIIQKIFFFFSHGGEGTFIKALNDMRGISLKWCDLESIAAFK